MAQRNGIKEKIIETITSIATHIPKKEENKATLVIPSYNEEKTIRKIITEAQKVKEIDQVLVIDDGSKDNTADIAQKFGAEVIIHPSNLGKGEAIETGIINSKNEIIVFLDADWKNINDKKIRSLINPIIKGKADFIKASFKLARGRVTEMAVKPMMKVLYPKESFSQPISGQFAGKKSFLKQIKIEPRWGIDISILLEAIEKGQKVLEVDVGEIIHKGRPTEEKAEMSKQVMETMLKKSGLLVSKHKIVIFTDKTLFQWNRMLETSKKLTEMLRQKKAKIILLTSKDIEKEYKKYFDSIIKIKTDPKEENILRKTKQAVKKYDANLEDCILVANMPGFQLLIEEVDKSLCFVKSPQALKEKSTEINSLSDILIYIE